MDIFVVLSTEFIYIFKRLVLSGKNCVKKAVLSHTAFDSLTLSDASRVQE